MGKISVIITSIDQAVSIKEKVDAYLIPMKSLSINYQNTFNIEDIKIIKKLNKEVFVFINKNIENNELKQLEKTLKQIDKLDINGIIFYDVALVELKKKFNLKTNLVWHQEHMTNNYGTVNYWYKKGIKYAYLSSEITKREMDEIKEKTKAKIFVNVFGYIPMFTSKRHLVKNYIDTFNIKKKGNIIYKEGKSYHIEDKKEGTTVYSNYILNVKDEINADYLVYNANLIPNFEEILKTNKLKEENGFLYQETIYKVK